MKISVGSNLSPIQHFVTSEENLMNIYGPFLLKHTRQYPHTCRFNQITAFTEEKKNLNFRLSFRSWCG